MDINRIIHVAAEAGRIVLQSGGETYRVEETITRICTSLGVKDTDSFVTPTGIILSATDENGKTISLVKRIHHRTVDLEKLSKINQLSRSTQNKYISIDDIEKELAAIEQTKKYTKFTLIICSCFAAAFFTLLFGGNYRDFTVSFLIGGVLELISIVLGSIKINDFFINVVGGAAASFLAIIAVNINLGNHIDKITIGSIMLLVPGLAITNAIKDTISGDLLAGISRAVEAFFIAIAIAIGSGIVLKLWLIIGR